MSRETDQVVNVRQGETTWNMNQSKADRGKDVIGPSPVIRNHGTLPEAAELEGRVSCKCQWRNGVDAVCRECVLFGPFSSCLRMKTIPGGEDGVGSQLTGTRTMLTRQHIVGRTIVMKQKMENKEEN